jgi:hypothetical protein
MKNGDKVVFILGLGNGQGEIVKTNAKTVIVKVPGGDSIKRHIEKHNVREI